MLFFFGEPNFVPDGCFYRRAKSRGTNNQDHAYKNFMLAAKLNVYNI